MFDLQLEEIREILKTLFNLTVKLCDETAFEESECKNYCLLVEILKEILTKPSFKCFLHNGLMSDIANVFINLPQCCLCTLVPEVRRRKWEDSVPHTDGYPLEYEVTIYFLHFMIYAKFYVYFTVILAAPKLSSCNMNQYIFIYLEEQPYHF